MCKLVWIENSLHSISLHWVPEYVICVPPWAEHLVAECDITAPLGWVDLWSDVPPMGRDILWPSLILLQVRLTFHQASGQGDLWSDVPPQWHLVARYVTPSVRMTSGQTYPHGQRHHLAKCVTNSVRLTSGQMYPIPWQRHLVAKCDITAPLGQVDLWSDVPPWAETSCSQV